MRVADSSLSRGLTVVAALALCAVSGCSGAAPGPAASPPGEGSAARPLVALLDEDADIDPIVQRARGIEVKRCMGASGFPDYTPPAEPPVVKNDQRSVVGLGSATLDTDAADAPPPSGTDVPERERRALEGSGRLVEVTGSGGQVVGFPTDGCGATAELALFGGVEGRKQRTLALMALKQAEDVAGREALADARVVEKLGAWKKCMSAKGHEANTPADLSTQLPRGVAWQNWPAAQDDVACKEQSGLMSTALTVMAEKERAALAANPGMTTTWRDTQAQVIARAKKIVAS